MEATSGYGAGRTSRATSPMRLEIEAPSTGWIVVLTHRPFVRARMKKEREIAIGVMYHIIAQQVNNLITGFQTPNRET